jgi:hypothetical protein
MLVDPVELSIRMPSIDSANADALTRSGHRAGEHFYAGSSRIEKIRDVRDRMVCDCCHGVESRNVVADFRLSLWPGSGRDDLLQLNRCRGERKVERGRSVGGNRDGQLLRGVSEREHAHFARPCWCTADNVGSVISRRNGDAGAHDCDPRVGYRLSRSLLSRSTGDCARGTLGDRQRRNEHGDCERHYLA